MIVEILLNSWKIVSVQVGHSSHIDNIKEVRVTDDGGNVMHFIREKDNAE